MYICYLYYLLLCVGEYLSMCYLIMSYNVVSVRFMGVLWGVMCYCPTHLLEYA